MGMSSLNCVSTEYTAKVYMDKDYTAKSNVPKNYTTRKRPTTMSPRTSGERCLFGCEWTLKISFRFKGHMKHWFLILNAESEIQKRMLRFSVTWFKSIDFPRCTISLHIKTVMADCMFNVYIRYALKYRIFFCQRKINIISLWTDPVI